MPPTPQAQAYYPDGSPIPNEKLAEAIQQGTAGYMPGSTVIVTDKSGKRYNLPAERVPDAFKQGWRPEAPAETHVKDVAAYESAHPVESTFRSADEAFNSPGARTAFTEGVLEGDTPGTPLWAAHQAAKKFVPGYGQAAEAVRTAHPTAATLGQVAPLAAQMVGGGPGEAVMQLGAGVLEETAPRAAAALAGRFATSTLGKAGQAAARTGFQGGFETAAYDAGQQAQQLALSDKEITAERFLAAVGHVAGAAALGTTLGGILGGAGSLTKSGYEAAAKSEALNPEMLAWRSFGGTPSQLKKMGKLSGQLPQTPEQAVAIESDIALTKAYEDLSHGGAKLTDYEKQLEGAKLAMGEALRTPGAVSAKSMNERAVILGKAAEAGGKEEGDFYKALDAVAKPDVNEVKLAMRKYAQDLIDHGTGGDINAGRKLIRQYIDRINNYDPETGVLRGKELNSFEDLFSFRKDDLRWKDTPGAVGKNYINNLNRVMEGAIEAEIAKLNAYAVQVPGKGWVISPGKPYELPKLSGVREVLGGGKPELERLVAGGGTPANLEAWAAYRAVKDRYARLMAAKLQAEYAARAEASGKHGLTNVISVATAAAEAASHGVGMGLVTGLGVKTAAAVLSPGRRNALMAQAMKAIRGGTDTTAIKLSAAVKGAVKAGKTVAAESITSLPKNASKIGSKYWADSEPAREVNANPAASAERVAASVAPIVNIDANVGRAVATKLTGDLNWLSQKLATGEFQIAPLAQNSPAMAVNAISGKKGKGRASLAARLSSSAMARFSRQNATLINPLGAIEKYSRTGRLPPELPEVLSERRPRLQAQLQSEYVNHIQDLAEQGKRQSYAGRIGGSLLTGMTFDSTMEPGPQGGVAFYQQVWLTESTSGGDQSGGQGGDQGPKPSGPNGGHISSRLRDRARDHASAGDQAERDPGEK